VLAVYVFLPPANDTLYRTATSSNIVHEARLRTQSDTKWVSLPEDRLDVRNNRFIIAVDSSYL